MNKDERDRFYLENFYAAQQVALDALRERDQAAEKLERANQACFAWKVIVEQAGLNTNGNSTVGAGTSSSAPTAIPAPTQAGNATDTDGDADSLKAGNKTVFVLKAVENAGEHGITAGDIRSAAIQAGVRVYAGFPYTVLHRLKSQRRLRLSADGKYVATKR